MIVNPTRYRCGSHANPSRNQQPKPMPWPAGDAHALGALLDPGTVVPPLERPLNPGIANRSLDLLLSSVRPAPSRQAHAARARRQEPPRVHHPVPEGLIEPQRVLRHGAMQPVVPPPPPHRHVVTGVSTESSILVPAWRCHLYDFMERLNASLAEQARSGAKAPVVAYPWRKWIEVGLASPQPTRYAAFAQIFREAMTNAHHIHVNLDAVAEPAYIMRSFGRNGTFPDMDADGKSPHCVIADELFCLRHDPNLFAKTTFYVRDLPLGQAYALRDPIADVRFLRRTQISGSLLEGVLRKCLAQICEAGEGADPDMRQEPPVRPRWKPLKKQARSFRKVAEVYGMRNISALCRELTTHASYKNTAACRTTLTHLQAETYRTIFACYDLWNPGLRTERLAQARQSRREASRHHTI